MCKLRNLLNDESNDYLQGLESLYTLRNITNSPNKLVS